MMTCQGNAQHALVHIRNAEPAYPCPARCHAGRTAPHAVGTQHARRPVAQGPCLMLDRHMLTLEAACCSCGLWGCAWARTLYQTRDSSTSATPQTGTRKMEATSLVMSMRAWSAGRASGRGQKQRRRDRSTELGDVHEGLVCRQAAGNCLKISQKLLHCTQVQTLIPGAHYKLLQVPTWRGIHDVQLGQCLQPLLLIVRQGGSLIKVRGIQLQQVCSEVGPRQCQQRMGQMALTSTAL